jgi:putative restriction endonuclease
MSYFENWMRQEGLSESSIKKYEGAITGALTQWAVESALISGSLADLTNAAEFAYLAERIAELPVFEERNATGHHMYSSALLKYAQYLAKSPSNSIEGDIDSIVDSDVLSTTEKATLIKSRIGQGAFRGKLINYWKCCSVSRFPDVNLLVASHIKPWALSDNAERTDVFNGLLLLPNLDRAFDLGYITFSDAGDIVISAALRSPELAGISNEMHIQLADRHKIYMDYHRKYVFEKASGKN